MAIFNSYVMLYYQKVGELKLHRNQSGLKPLPGNLHFGIRHTMILAELAQTVSAAPFGATFVCSTLVDETPRPAAHMISRSPCDFPLRGLYWTNDGCALK